MTLYKGDKFTLEYPAHWKATNEDGILNFFPAGEYAALTFSYHTDVDISPEEIKVLVLEMNKVKDKPENVRKIKKGNIVEYSYEFVEDDNVKWVVRAVRKKTALYLITINCDLKKWDTEKDIFLKVVNSFKFN